MTGETLEEARDAVAMAFGVLPGLLNRGATGPMVREAQRHLCGWVLQPMAELLAQIIEAMGRAKELGLSTGQLESA
jgi:hypothetical protein